MVLKSVNSNEIYYCFMFMSLTWSVVFREVCWAPPHTAGQTAQIWPQEEAGTWRATRYPESSVWSLALPPYSGLDEGTAAVESALEVHPQSTECETIILLCDSLQCCCFENSFHSNQMNWTLVWNRRLTLFLVCARVPIGKPNRSTMQGALEIRRTR